MLKKKPYPSLNPSDFGVGTVGLGNDGNLWKIVKNKNGIKEWKLINKKTKKNKSKNNKTKKVKGKKYFTHHNRSRPYMVVVNKSVVTIYKLDKSYDDFSNPSENNYTELVKEYKNVKKIFIGNSIKGDDAYQTSNSEKEAKQFGLGNSILLYINKSNNTHEYVYIGESVYKFKTDEEIKHYYSMIDKNDVPLPVAIGNNKVFFLMENASYGFAERKDFEDFPKIYSWGLHSYYRLWKINEFQNKEQPIKTKKIKVKIISK